jgi:hypothetical protein
MKRWSGGEVKNLISDLSRKIIYEDNWCQKKTQILNLIILFQNVKSRAVLLDTLIGTHKVGSV